jgi:hypothetical protein
MAKSGAPGQSSREYLKGLEEITQEIFLAKGAQLFASGDPSRGLDAVWDGAVGVYGALPRARTGRGAKALAGSVPE